MFTPEQIIPYLSKTLAKTNLSLGEKIHEGKVRDTYIIDGKRILITTDRQSAFDINLVSVPFKGQVLNRAADFWFKKTEHIIKNHSIAVPDVNIVVAQQLKIFPVEFVVRAYMTGSTETSIWVNYKKGVRDFCGNTLPEGIEKNHPLPKVMVTPTTKPETGHDESISRAEIIKRGLMTAEDFDYVAQKSIEIFTLGQEHCAKNRLILVDTKYEFGKNAEGEIILADEVHTPDSSRFWDAESYDINIAEGKSPKSFDKDILRRWFSDRCDPYNDAVLPTAPPELIAQLSSTYMQAYEKITGEEFIPEISDSPEKRMEENLKNFL